MRNSSIVACRCGRNCAAPADSNVTRAWASPSKRLPSALTVAATCGTSSVLPASRLPSVKCRFASSVPAPSNATRPVPGRNAASQASELNCHCDSMLPEVRCTSDIGRSSGMVRPRACRSAMTCTCAFGEGARSPTSRNPSASTVNARYRAGRGDPAVQVVTHRQHQLQPAAGLQFAAPPGQLSGEPAGLIKGGDQRLCARLGYDRQSRRRGVDRQVEVGQGELADPRGLLAHVLRDRKSAADRRVPGEPRSVAPEHGLLEAHVGGQHLHRAAAQRLDEARRAVALADQHQVVQVGMAYITCNRPVEAHRPAARARFRRVAHHVHQAGASRHAGRLGLRKSQLLAQQGQQREAAARGVRLHRPDRVANVPCDAQVPDLHLPRKDRPGTAPAGDVLLGLAIR